MTLTTFVHHTSRRRPTLADDNTTDDGVNRDGLDYRAGYVEGIMAFLTRLKIEAVRAKPEDHAMLQKMKGG